MPKRKQSTDMKKANIFVICFVLLTTLLFFFAFFFQGKLPIPADSVVGLYHPFRDFYAPHYPNGMPFKNFLITDPLFQQYPWRELAMEGQKHVSLTLWNPYNGAGEPLFANMQSASLYPLNIIFYFIAFPFAWSLLIVAQPVLSVIFLYFYLRNLSLSWISSLFGGIIFAFSGFMVAWMEWGTIGHVILWVPLILLSIDKIFYRTNYLNNSKIKSKNAKIQIKTKNFLTWPLVLIFSLASAFFAGHLQTFFYLYLFSLCYFFLRWWQNGKQKKLLFFFCLYTVLFLLLTAVQWLTTIQLIQESSRAIDQANWQDKEGWFLPWQHLIQFIAPDYFGNPTTMNYWGTWNYAELVGYIGIFPLLLSFFAIVTRRDNLTIFFAGAALLSFLLMLPHVISQLPYTLQIPFISTSQPTRMMGIVDFSLSILAAFGLDYLLKEKKKLRMLVFLSFCLVIIVGIIFLYVFFSLKSPASEELMKHLSVTKRNLYFPLLFTGMACGLSLLLVFFSRKKKIFAVVIAALCLVTVFDLWKFSSKFTPFVDASLLYPHTKITNFLVKQSENYPWRFLAVDYVENQKRIFPPNLASHYHIYTLDSYNPLLLRRYQEFAAVSEWEFTDIPDFSFNRILLLNNYESRLIDLMGVKYFISLTEIQNKSMRFLFREGNSRVYENLEAFPRAFMVYEVKKGKTKKEIGKMILDPKINLKKTAIVEESLPLKSLKGEVANSIKVVDYSSDKIALEVDTAKEGLLVLTDTFYPTWKAKICSEAASCTDTKIYRINYTLRGIIVPSGKKSVLFYNSLL